MAKLFDKLQRDSAIRQPVDRATLLKAMDEIQLYVGVAAWKQAAQALVAVAPVALREGAYALLRQQVELLPASVLPEYPTLIFSWGIALAEEHDQQALAALEAAFEAFQAEETEGGKRRQILTAAARVESQIRARTTHAGIEPWINQLQSLCSKCTFDGDIEYELRASTALLAGLLYFRPDSPEIEALGSRVLALARVTDNASDALTAAIYLLAYSQLKKRDDSYAQACSLAAIWVKCESVSIMRVGEWLTEYALIQFYRDTIRLSASDALREAINVAAEWVDRHQIHDLRFKVERIRYEALRIDKNVEGAAAVLLAAESKILSANLLDWLLYFYKRSELLITQHRPHEALACTENVMRLCDETATPHARRSTFIAMRAVALVQTYQFDEAIQAHEQLTSIAAIDYKGYFIGMTSILRSHISWDRDREDAERLLEIGLKELRLTGSLRLFWYAPQLASITLDRALSCGIESQYAREIIRVRTLPPPPNASGHWPWIIRIRALGMFQIERDGKPVSFEGKAQRRPLDLLKAIVAADQYEVAVDGLLLRLFPSAEHDDPKASFEVALFRLRKLLGINGLVRFQGGKLSLDPALVWCDLPLFESITDELLQPRCDESGNDFNVSAASDAIKLYTGKLFGADCPPLAVARRDQLRRQVERLIVQAATTLEAQRKFVLAAQWWENGLRQEPFNEAFYRGLMRCHAAQGNSAAALALFRRCAEVLSTMLGVAPSRNTEELRAQIQNTAGL